MRRADPRGEGRPEVQGLHPPADLHQAPLRRLRRRAEPHRRGGRLAGQGVQAGEARQEARPLLPAAEAEEPRRAGLVRHPQAHRTRSASSSRRTCTPSPRPTRCSRASSTAWTSTPPPTASATSTTTASPISSKRSATSALGLNDVEADIIGRSYEYLIRKFAEGSGQSAGEFYTPAGGRLDHGSHHGPRAGHGCLRPLLRLGRPAHQVRAGAGREDEACARSKTVRAAQDLRPGIRRPHLGHGEHEHDHPRHGRRDRDRRHLQESQVPHRATACRPSTASSPIPCGTRTGSRKRTTTPTSSTASPRAPASPATRPTGAGCSTSSPA